MDELTLPNGTTSADATDIMQGLNAHFKEWYQTLAGNHGRDVHSLDTWEEGFQDWSAFYKAQQSTNVPKRLLRKIWQAMTTVPDLPALQQDMLQTLDTAPTYSQFRHAISGLPKGKAAGMDGLTYDMMKAWPDSFTHAAYDTLLTLRRDKDVPTYWKWMWLVPIPKKAGGTRPEDMRPLALIPCIRKVWVGLIL